MTKNIKDIHNEDEESYLKERTEQIYQEMKESTWQLLKAGIDFGFIKGFTLTMFFCWIILQVYFLYTGFYKELVSLWLYAGIDLFIIYAMIKDIRRYQWELKQTEIN